MEAIKELHHSYFKLLHRTVVTKKELFIYVIEDNSLCSYCGQNDSIIHTFSKCHWTQLFFLEVIKWFNVENVTSFSLSPSELIFGIKAGSKKQNTFKINKKLNFTILFAKYYLYTQKLSLKCHWDQNFGIPCFYIFEDSLWFLVIMPNFNSLRRMEVAFFRTVFVEVLRPPLLALVAEAGLRISRSDVRGSPQTWCLHMVTYSGKFNCPRVKISCQLFAARL